MKKIRLVAVMSLLICAGCAMGATPKYVFYFIGDGMGIAQVQALRTYYKQMGDSVAQLPHFYDAPVMGYITTYSANDDITDSAAAGTALACGSKTRNGMIGMDADTVALTSVAKKMKAAGRGVAVMSSVCLDDATPSAFYASRPSRHHYHQIEQQGAASGFDFMAGAYFRDPYGVRCGVPGNVFAEYEAAGYTIVRGREGFNDAIKADARRVLWLDNDTTTENRIGYAIDGDNGDMTLPQMVRSGIDFLYTNHPQGFFMMAEGGAIDHMGHGNDPSGVLRETIEFDAAVREAIAFYNEHPQETLIVITADHETGGFSVGTIDSRHKVNMHYLSCATMSKSVFGDRMRELLAQRGKDIAWEDVTAFMADRLGLGIHIPMTANEEARLQEVLQKVIDEKSEDQKTLYANYDELTKEIYKLYSAKLGLGWTTVHHTGSPVPLFVMGVGAEAFDNKGWLDNTDVPRIIADVCGVNE